MTAVAMVAVMIVAAFAVVGMADNGAADTNKEKYILGTTNNPYVLNINDTATSSIEFNETAFTERAQIEFAYKWQNQIAGVHGSTSIDYTKLTIDKTTSIIVNDQNNNTCDEYEIKLTPISDVKGAYTVNIKGTKISPANGHTTITIKVSITDKIKENDPNKDVVLPTQTFEFKAYLMVVDSTTDEIKLNTLVDGVGPKGKTINFSFEKSYNITSTVFVNNNISYGMYRYYAVGLPDGISMTIDGKIGGMLTKSSDTIENAPFTVYAVSESGHVVSEEMTYSIGEKAVRDFKITIEGNEKYTTTTAGKTVTLMIRPEGSKLTDVVVSYGGVPDSIGGTVDDPITTDTTREINCDGTGIIKVSVSAKVVGSNVTITKTVTVYVLSEIFDTDLDPEVTN